MKTQFAAILTGSDSLVEGVAKPINFNANTQAWEFKSIDETLHLVIARNDKGRWTRIDGTEPYLSGWVDELAEQVEKQ